MFKQSKRKQTLAELTNAYGKSTLLSIYADEQCEENDKTKVIISVPDRRLVHDMREQCMHISKAQCDIDKINATGIFVCTHADMLSLSDEVLGAPTLTVLVDEFHIFCDQEVRTEHNKIIAPLLKICVP